jgi:TRAP-type C4-dicarboxylate transport system permease small subunit
VVLLLDRVLRGLLALLLGVLTASVFLQVLARFVLRYPLPWTEEVTRLAFVYSIFAGATIAVREKGHINVDLFVNLLPRAAARAVRLGGSVLVAVFLGFVLWQGVEFIAATGVQMTPVLQIPFRYLYVVIPASAGLMLLYLVLGVVDDLRAPRAGGPPGPATPSEGIDAVEVPRAPGASGAL